MVWSLIILIVCLLFCYIALSLIEVYSVCEQVRKIGKVARAIAIMSHPIPSANDSHSVQIILPQKQLGRKSDM
jgi:RAB protein geranylgeranyltransferase component A